MSMFRRRMIMSLGSAKPDLLAGYRTNNTGGSYGVTIEWLDDETLRINKYNGSFSGPTAIGKGFINSYQSSSSYVYCYNTTPMSTLELGKTYKLTLTVVEVAKNTATPEQDGAIIMAIGRQGHYGTRATVAFSDLVVGYSFSCSNTYVSSYNCISSGAFNFSGAGLLWDITFKVKFEEV